MDYTELIKEIARQSNMGLGDVARKLGITRQALYYRLKGDMKLSSLEEVLNVLGAEIVFKKGERYYG